MARGTRNIFISHRQEDEGHISPLKGVLRQSGLNVRDSSVYSGKNSNRARNRDYIRRLLRKRIRWAGTLIVIVSQVTRRHEWVDWEIEYARYTNTRIVGVWAPDQGACPVPEPLRKYADAMVPWDGEMIRAAIEDRLVGWHDPDGNPVPICDLPDVKCS